MPAPSTTPAHPCRRSVPLDRLSRMLESRHPLTPSERTVLLALAQACYESWCLRPGFRRSVQLRTAGLILLARACERAERHRQGLIHARRAWRLLRTHPRRHHVMDTVVGLLIRLSEHCAPDQVDHWRHLGCGLGLAAAA